MAYIWHMTASFGTEEVAKAFVKHYAADPFDVPHAGRVELRLSVEDNESGWEVGVYPYVEQAEHGGPWHLNGHGGATSAEEIADIDACAKVLYERLANIYNYRFALTGFEVGDWRSVGGLLDDLSPGGLYQEQRSRGGAHAWSGLVVTRELYESALTPPGFVRFSSGFLWIPYTSIAEMEP